jgi:Xaa-Pro aminopeptidase
MMTLDAPTRPSVAALTERLARLRAYMQAHDLDTFLVSNPYNRRYLSGFTGEDAPPLDSAGLLIVTTDRVQLVTDARYDIQAGHEVQVVEIVLRQGRTITTLVA